ncbi:hypothetical protein B0H16DRAFT_1449162 [Mycena metata]|uniref:Uncharacterized protein n=1 Tax=Mycena metata TaxID=1033252 RepID=A0AAD7NVL8_9AGAR|nr:hypothetical protein B0H16DRAFT_1449162 [Mycena metata]
MVLRPRKLKEQFPSLRGITSSINVAFEFCRNQQFCKHARASCEAMLKFELKQSRNICIPAYYESNPPEHHGQNPSPRQGGRSGDKAAPFSEQRRSRHLVKIFARKKVGCGGMQRLHGWDTAWLRSDAAVPHLTRRSPNIDAALEI